MTTDSSILARKIPRTGERGGLQSMGSYQEPDRTEYAGVHACPTLFTHFGSVNLAKKFSTVLRAQLQGQETGTAVWICRS